MGYPEPIPIIKSKDAEDFDRRLSKFKLSESQREFYRKVLKDLRDDD